MTLIKDLIEIPDRVQSGDFVLRLSEGVSRPQDTLQDYVVTPELVDCFDNALRFIQSAIEGRTSKATYLHGSFGSGKSHFMAVLHLILKGNTAARSIKELAPVIANHNPWIEGKKFLLVPYHAIGSVSMEACILGGYARFIQDHHPDAPIPGIYLANELFQDAQNLRQRLGNEAFFAELNQTHDSGWGDMTGIWDAATFEQAVNAPAGDEKRAQLVGDLVKQFFSSYNLQVDNQTEGYLSLDQGLSILSKHTQQLGYDGLILFLDELILWLASRAGDLNFVHTEGQKLAKLVEAQAADRPIPIISIVARQRDLRELVGDTIPGADRMNFSDALKHWEGRFHRIVLEDRNLPAIAHKRVLRCKTAAARDELDAAFEDAIKLKDTTLNILLTQGGDRQMFQQVYPFSPALIQTLIALSSLLQRERTALKIMMQLLVEQRDSLEVGNIIPVGDLFDLVTTGEEAFSPDMATHFNHATRLYRQKFLPLLERDHDLTWDAAQALPITDGRRQKLINDARLVKTLLLSALVPDVEPLRTLTAERLAALNYGTIKSPIRGRETQEALKRCKKWASQIGELRISDDEHNPTLSVQLSGVDTDMILQQAEREDNQANRARLISQMLMQRFQITDDGRQQELTYTWLWRNTKRTCQVLFKNVRELPDISLQNSDDRWLVIIDYPFDQENHSPSDDLGRVQDFQDKFPEGTKTICWLPAFLSPTAQKDVANLLKVNHVLAGDRFSQYTVHLSPQDRQTAKSILDGQRSSLDLRVRQHLETAYGIRQDPDVLDPDRSPDLAERFVSLCLGLQLRPPVTTTLADALDKLLDQVLRFEFPGAPLFGSELRRSDLDKIWVIIQSASQAPENRLLIDKNQRKTLQDFALPLHLGELSETHFLLGQHWRTHFLRQAQGERMTVARLRQWINQPDAMGLTPEAENLVILTFAEQTNRAFYQHNLLYKTANLRDLPDTCELREEALPDAQAWSEAITHAEALLEIPRPALCKSSTVAQFCAEVYDQATARQSSCQAYLKALQSGLQTLDRDQECDRVTTARATQTLFDQLCSQTKDQVIETLAQATFATSTTAMAHTLTLNETLNQILNQTRWETFESLESLPADSLDLAIRNEIQQVSDRLNEILQSDEHVHSLKYLRTLEKQALRLITTAAKPPITIIDPPPKPDPDPDPKPDPNIVKGEEKDLDLEAAQNLIKKLKKDFESGQKINLTISWIIQNK
ncbi:hypothetical protein PN441_06685 [Spirulina major CS-329]|uniref:hypothetical protein n=1 Tax=Spirulina TaxID=1154 RepID=UPI00232B5372|nr:MULTISPECIES: hypothetical protein [Spirulina]MDB9495457.1 hypothetical protein [Spirulina subsalsa CS-330]MDB9502753.1 hypothetical protein [Spirulina major CS-329]